MPEAGGCKLLGTIGPLCPCCRFSKVPQQAHCPKGWTASKCVPRSTPHVANQAKAWGVLLPTVARMLGQAQSIMTRPCAHVGDHKAKAAAERVGTTIAEALPGGTVDDGNNFRDRAAGSPDKARTLQQAEHSSVDGQQSCAHIRVGKDFPGYGSWPPCETVSWTTQRLETITRRSTVIFFPFAPSRNGRRPSANSKQFTVTACPSQHDSADPYGPTRGLTSTTCSRSRRRDGVCESLASKRRRRCPCSGRCGWV